MNCVCIYLYRYIYQTRCSPRLICCVVLPCFISKRQHKKTHPQTQIHQGEVITRHLLPPSPCPAPTCHALGRFIVQTRANSVHSPSSTNKKPLWATSEHERACKDARGLQRAVQANMRLLQSPFSLMHAALVSLTLIQGGNAFLFQIT